MKEKLINRLASARNVERADQMKAYMKGHFEYIGILTTHRRELTRDLIKDTKNLDKHDIFILAIKLWQMDEREYQYVAMDILKTIERKVSIEDIDKVIWFITEKAWWDTVDWLSSHLIGQIFKSKPPEMEAYLLQWLESDNIWLNRTCLIFQLFYKGQTDFEMLKDHIYALQHKKEFFIQKAIGWGLRQYSRIDPLAVEDFINETPLSNLATREGMKLINKNR